MVGLATPFITDNFGTKLQAYALQRFLDLHGIDNEIINYRFEEKIIDPRKLLLPNRAAYKKEEKARKKAFKEDPGYMCAMAVRRSVMDAFVRDNLRLSERCGTLKQAGALAEKRYSSVVCGSDQIWLPSHILERYYTLEFVPDGIKRIAYAPSFGVNDMPGYIKKDCINALRKFDSISVRERSGAEIAKEITGGPCAVAADPTLLLTREAWRDAVKNTPVRTDKGYALGYFIGGSSGKRLIAENWAHSNGLEFIMLPGGTSSSILDKEYADRLFYDAGPFDFIKLIENADAVFTDSFHGSVFSIIFGKPLFCFERFRKGDAVSTNSRIYSLLEMAGMKNRLVSSSNIDLSAAGKTDYGKAEENIRCFREESAAYLLNALKNEKQYM